MNKIKLIIPQYLEDELTGFSIESSEEFPDSETSYKMDPSIADAANILLAIIAIPNSIDGISNWFTKLKKFFEVKNKSERIIIQTPDHRYILDKSTTNETFNEVMDYLKKLVDNGKLERNI